jgi:peptide/nickel transport system substrate-binding protein
MMFEAVKYQMEWIKDPKNGCWSAGWLKPLKSVEVVDAYTVKWNFNAPWGGFLGIMANVPGYMLSPKVLKEGPKKYDTHPSGTGPYILEDRSPGNFIKVTPTGGSANPSASLTCPILTVL